MGVSYAPPAYYADRLCERGRCYLRDLLNPDQEDVLELDDLEAKLKSDRRSIRDAQFSPRVKDEKDVVVISKEERELRKAHDDEVDLELRKHTFRKAEAIFNKGGGDGRGNPWKQSLRRTMFWM